MEWDDICPVDGKIPARPEFLLRPDHSERHAAAIIADSLLTGKTIVVGGISFIGASMKLVPTISIARLVNGVLRGNTLSIGHPTHELGFRPFDVNTTDYATSDILPDGMVYFVGVTEPRFANEDAPEAELICIARFVFPFISDEGPPKGTHW